MDLGYFLKYNRHKYSKVFDLVSWIISNSFWQELCLSDKVSGCIPSLCIWDAH